LICFLRLCRAKNVLLLCKMLSIECGREDLYGEVDDFCFVYHQDGEVEKIGVFLCSVFAVQMDTYLCTGRPKDLRCADGFASFVDVMSKLSVYRVLRQKSIHVLAPQPPFLVELVSPKSLLTSCYTPRTSFRSIRSRVSFPCGIKFAGSR
jgi:hypothetical protein